MELTFSVESHQVCFGHFVTGSFPTVQILMWCEYERTVSVSWQLLQPVRTAEVALFFGFLRFFFCMDDWAVLYELHISEWNNYWVKRKVKHITVLYIRVKNNLFNTECWTDGCQPVLSWWPLIWKKQKTTLIIFLKAKLVQDQDKYLEKIKYICKIFMWKFESNISLAFI